MLRLVATVLAAVHLAQGSLPASKANITSYCGQMAWTRNSFDDATKVGSCWWSLGNAWVNNSIVSLTSSKSGVLKQGGSVWSRAPFTLPDGDVGVFAPEAKWSIEVAVLVSPKRPGRSIGDGIGFWLVANESVSNKPEMENWGINMYRFSGLGFTVLMPYVSSQAWIAAALEKDSAISLKALPYLCILQNKAKSLSNKILFVTVNKDADLISVTMENSTLHRICNFSIPIPPRLGIAQWPSLHFGMTAFSDHLSDFTVLKIDSTFRQDGQTTAPTVTPQHSNTAAFYAGLISGIVIFVLVASCALIIFCMRKKHIRTPAPKSTRNALKHFADELLPMVRPPPRPAPFSTAGVNPFSLERPSSKSLDSLRTSSQDRSSFQSAPASRRTHPSEEASPYASINIKDVSLEGAPQAYLVPSSSKPPPTPPKPRWAMRTASQDALNISYNMPDLFMNDIAERLPYHKDQLEVDSNQMTVLDQIGCGAFGIVSMAEYKSTDGKKLIVAIKQVRDPVDQFQRHMLWCELRLLAHIGNHPNIVKLHGAVTTDPNMFCMILEYCEVGNLKHFLHENHDKYRAIDNEMGIGRQLLTRRHLVTLGQHVANGMEFIHSKRCIHRDLAARNILLTQRGAVAKITDFGLAKDIYQDGMYQSASKNKIPWPWYAPEYLKSLVYVLSSDVWSYGVLLWEIFSLGERPYAGTEFDASFIKQLENGLRLEKPQRADDGVFKIVSSCWQLEPNNRPKFSSLNLKMKAWLESH